MHTKLIAAFGAALATFGTFGAVAQSVPTFSPTFEQAMEICDLTVKKALTDENFSPNMVFELIAPEARKPLATVCYAYTRGFLSGVNYNGEQS